MIDCGASPQPSGLHARSRAAFAGKDYNLADLVEECAIAANIAAAGGNASLMAIG